MSTFKSKTFHHGDLKAVLAASAYDLVTLHGVEGFSLREVARHADVSTAAPYRHFSSKDALLAEVARQGFKRLRDVLEAAEDGGASSAIVFLNQVNAYVEFALANRNVYRLMFGSHLDKGAHPHLRETGDQVFAILEVRLKHIAEDQRAARAAGCWALVHGVATLAIDGQLSLHSDSEPELSAILNPIVESLFAMAN